MDRKKHPTPLKSEGRSLTIMGEIGWDYSAKEMIETLLALGNAEPIEMIIMSEGGTVVEALAVYDFVRANGYDITTSVYGYAASAATVLALCGRRVRMGSSSVWMVHSPYYFEYVPATVEPMEPEESEDGYKKPRMNGDEGGTYIKRIEPTLQAIIARIYADKTGGTEAEMLALMVLGDETNKLYNAEETLALGFIDEILTDAMASAAAFINQFNQTPSRIMNLLSRMAAMFGRTESTTTEDEVVKDIQAKFATLDEVKATLAAISAKLEANDPGDTDAAADTEPTVDTTATELAAVKAELETLAAANKALAVELADIKAKGPVTAPKANGMDTGEAGPEKTKEENFKELWAAEMARKMAAFNNK
jgi:ATP-dependent protease ClpP protease subunit